MSDEETKKAIAKILAESKAKAEEELAKLSPEERAAKERQQELRRAINDALSDLDEKELAVIRARFGSANAQTHTGKEVGELMGMTRERIRRIEQRAQEKLKNSPRPQTRRKFQDD